MSDSRPTVLFVWCTGFRPALSHLRPLQLPRHHGHPCTHGTEAADRPGLFLLGYGDWTGPGSATLVGAARTARTTVTEILARLSGRPLAPLDRHMST